jgi:hypothetical protein
MTPIFTLNGDSLEAWTNGARNADTAPTAAAEDWIKLRRETLLLPDFMTTTPLGC